MPNRAAPTRTRFLLPVLLLFAVIAVAACGGTVATAPANTLALSPAPASPNAPTASPSPTPSPTVDLTAQAAEAYLALATRINDKVAALVPLSATATLAEIKTYYARRAEIQAEGVAGVQAITFPPRLRDDVENLIRAANSLKSAESAIAASASLADVSARTGSLTSAFAAMSRAANILREDLGLPPTASPIPPPTLRPTATPSAVASIDPAASLKIGSPYTLEPMDAATMAQFQAGMKAALGTFANSFRFGIRWAVAGGQQVALVMVIEIPGIGNAVLTSPTFLDQMAASIAASSPGDITSVTILGEPVRLVDKLGAPIAVFVHGEGVAVVIGQAGASIEDVTAIATALIRART